MSRAVMEGALKRERNVQEEKESERATKRPNVDSSVASKYHYLVQIAKGWEAVSRVSVIQTVSQ